MGVPGLGTWIERHAARTPDAIVMRGDGYGFTYDGFAQLTRSFGADLVRRGVSPGDRVAYQGENHPAALISLFAARAVGAVWVPLLPGRPEDEVRSILDDCEPRVLIRGEAVAHAAAGIDEIAADELLTDTGTGPPVRAREADADELAVLGYTSGTTGRPKGVLLSEGNLLWGVVQMLAACGFTSSDVTLAAAPFTRIGGLGVTVLPTLFAGGALVVPDSREGAAVLGAIERARVSVVFANPDMLDAMVRAPGWAATDLSAIRTGVVGGAAVPEALLGRYLDRGVRLRHGYGLTEASPVVSLLTDAEAIERASSVGRPLPFVDVRARRRDGTDCGPGEPGEWWIRGPNVARGYWRSPSVVDADGWFPTGDIGSIDADGYLSFLDRGSSAVRIGDRTLYPASIEGRLYGTGGVLDTAVAEVDGRLIVGIVADENLAPRVDVISDLISDALPDPGTPVEIRIVDAIPRNAAGKVRRDDLRSLLSERPST